MGTSNGGKANKPKAKPKAKPWARPGLSPRLSPRLGLYIIEPENRWHGGRGLKLWLSVLERLGMRIVIYGETEMPGYELERMHYEKAWAEAFGECYAHGGALIWESFAEPIVANGPAIGEGWLYTPNKADQLVNDASSFALWPNF